MDSFCPEKLTLKIQSPNAETGIQWDELIDKIGMCCSTLYLGPYLITPLNEVGIRSLKVGGLPFS